MFYLLSKCVEETTEIETHEGHQAKPTTDEWGESTDHLEENREWQLRGYSGEGRPDSVPEAEQVLGG